MSSKSDYCVKRRSSPHHHQEPLASHRYHLQTSWKVWSLESGEAQPTTLMPASSRHPLARSMRYEHLLFECWWCWPLAGDDWASCHVELLRLLPSWTVLAHWRKLLSCVRSTAAGYVMLLLALRCQKWHCCRCSTLKTSLGCHKYVSVLMITSSKAF